MLIGVSVYLLLNPTLSVRKNGVLYSKSLNGDRDSISYLNVALNVTEGYVIPVS